MQNRYLKSIPEGVTQDVLSVYGALVSEGLLKADPLQQAVAEKLLVLENHLEKSVKLTGFFLGRKQHTAQGMYLYDSVGRGKSLLMDVFFESVGIEKKRRVHFHAFMQEIHARLRTFEGKADPLIRVAADIAYSAELLCFDEFQVLDIADAMILGRLFEALFAENVTIVATSNRHPDMLYHQGLHRDRFVPCIALIKERLEVVSLDGDTDYRRIKLNNLTTTYFHPLGGVSERFMEGAFYQLSGASEFEPTTLEVDGRTITIPRTKGDVAWFTFADLCEQNFWAHDYLAIAQRFKTVLLQNIPQMNAEKHNEAKRFVTLIDALYEHKVKLVATAEESPEKLYVQGTGAFEFERTVSRLLEMQSNDYQKLEHL